MYFPRRAEPPDDREAVHAREHHVQYDKSRWNRDADAFGFGGWLAMTKGISGMDVMMDDLVLQEDEVNPVMSALRDNGLEVSGSNLSPIIGGICILCS